VISLQDQRAMNTEARAKLSHYFGALSIKIANQMKILVQAQSFLDIF
jgi:hypothetical protein